MHSGPVVAGNVGTVRRLMYTMIGDTVNTAARIEGLTKDSPFDLLASDATVEKLQEPWDDLVRHDTLPIRGRAEPVGLWSLRIASSTVDETTSAAPSSADGPPAG